MAHASNVMVTRPTNCHVTALTIERAGLSILLLLLCGLTFDATSVSGALVCGNVGLVTARVFCNFLATSVDNYQQMCQTRQYG